MLQPEMMTEKKETMDMKRHLCTTPDRPSQMIVKKKLKKKNRFRHCFERGRQSDLQQSPKRILLLLPATEARREPACTAAANPE